MRSLTPPATRRCGTLPVALLSASLLVGFGWPTKATWLRRALATADEAGRIAALLEAPSDPPDPAVVAVVRSALQDPSEKVRLAAARALVRLGEPVDVALAVAWLASDDPEERTVGLQALSLRPSTDALAALRRALGDPRAELRAETCQLLGKLGAAPSLSAGERRATVATLVGRLEDPIPSVRAAAVRALGRLGASGALAAVAARLADADVQVRRAVPRALVGLAPEAGTSAVLPALRAALGQDDPEVRLEAVAALGRLSEPTTLPLLRDLARGRDLRVAVAAAAALGRLPGEAALRASWDLLAEQARRGLPEGSVGRVVRRSLLARAALAEGPALRALLLETLTEQREVVERRAAAALLGELAVQQPALAPPAPVLLTMLETTRDGPLGDALLRVLGTTGSEQALLPLLEGIESDLPSRSAAARWGLRQLARSLAPDDRAVGPLAAALRTRRGEQERIALLDLLGRWGSTAAQEPLLPWLSDPDERVRRAALEALARVPGRPAPLLEVLENHPDPSVRGAAAVALGRGTPPERLWPLVRARLGAPDPTDRHAWLLALLGSLRNTPPQARPPPDLHDVLGKLLLEGSRPQGRLAAEGLRLLGDRDAARRLRGALLERGASRRLAPALRRALGALGQPLPENTSGPEALADWLGGMALVASSHGPRTVQAALAALDAPWPARGAAAAVLAGPDEAADGALPEARLCGRLQQATDPVLLADLALWAGAGRGRCGPRLAAWLADRLQRARSELLARTLAEALWRRHRAGDAHATEALRVCVAEPPPPLLQTGCGPWVPAEEDAPPPASVRLAGTSGPLRWLVLRLSDGRLVPIRAAAGEPLVPTPPARPLEATPLATLPDASR